MYTVLLLALALSLPDALLNRPYTYDSPWVRVSSRCAMPIPATRVVAGTLPAGLQLTDRGEMLGVPTQPGKYGFTVEVSDGCSRRLEERQIRVAPAPILTAEAEELEFNCPQGAPPFSAGIVRVSGSTPGHAYSVDILEGPWLQATMRDGILPPENSALEADTVRLSINPAKLAPGAYTARLRLSADEKQAELARIRRHTEDLREQLSRERDRIMTQLLPRRYALRGEAQCLPVTVEIRFREASA